MSKSRITLTRRRSDDSILIQWHHPLSASNGRELFPDLSADHTTLNIGRIDYNEHGTPTFTPDRSEAAFCALASPAVQARIASSLRSYWHSG